LLGIGVGKGKVGRMVACQPASQGWIAPRMVQEWPPALRAVGAKQP